MALLLIGAYLGWQLLKGKQNAWKKELLIIVLIASLMDFHLQYMSIIMLLVLCLDLGERDKMKKQKELKENYLFCAVAIGIFGYLTVAFLAHYLGNQELTLVLFPKYTQAQIQQLNACKDKDEAVVIADTILDHNEYVSDAYHTKVYASAMEGDYMKVIECMEQSLAIKRYDVATYQAYNELLEELIFAYGNMGVHEPVEKLTEYKEKLPQKLAALEEKTHPIAFELRDKPVFKW